MKNHTSSMAENIGSILGIVLTTAIEVLAESSEHNRVQAKEREEAARWEHRKQAVFDTIDRAMIADHSRHCISASAKARTALRLRNDAIDYCSRRSEALMQHVEDRAARFEQYGS